MLLRIAFLCLLLGISQVVFGAAGRGSGRGELPPVDTNEVTEEPEDYNDVELIVRDRPNILLILADDLGYADVSFNAPTAGVTPEIVTPQLDKLATQGTIFTSAYVAHPFCGPSRMGLMAGRYPYNFSSPFNLPVYNSGHYIDKGMPTSEKLLSTTLQEAGYYTGLMGKWHLGHQAEHHPNARGFDEFYGFLGGGILYFGPYQEQTGSIWDYRAFPEHNGVDVRTLTSKDYITDVFTEQGVDFIENAASKEEPFFLFMSYNAPHSVLAAKNSDMAKFPHLTGNRRIYAGMVYALDRGVGELVKALKRTGQYHNTLILFLSDNGGREDQVGSGDNGVLRGQKGHVTEGGFRVPMFMHMPEVIPAGVTFDHPVSALDFYPTFAGLADVNIPETQELDGLNIWDAVLSGTDARPGEPIYTIACSASSVSVGIRQDHWKALKIGKGNWSLYNISNDISEQANLSTDNPTLLQDIVAEGSLWSEDHIQPLWWNNPSQEAQWKKNDMPHYETVFTLPQTP